MSIELETPIQASVVRQKPQRDANETVDALSLYMNEALCYRELRGDEIVALYRQIELGNKAQNKIENFVGSESALYALQQDVLHGTNAEQTMVARHLRVVVSVAKRYMGLGVPFPDLIQSGNIGLMMAVKNADCHRENFEKTFVTYSKFWIRTEILNCLTSSRKVIHVPPGRMYALSKILKFGSRFLVEHGREPTNEEIALHFDTSPSNIEKTLAIADMDPVSLDKGFADTDGPDDLSLHDALPDSHVTLEHWDQQLLEKQTITIIKEVLSDIEIRFITSMFLPKDLHHNPSFKEACEELSISKRQGERMRERIYKKLRSPRVSRLLDDS